MKIEKSKIRYKLTLNREDYDKLRKLYGCEGNAETFFQEGVYEPKGDIMIVYFTKLEYNIYKKLIKGDKRK